jgi:hypothetical protein
MKTFIALLSASIVMSASFIDAFMSIPRTNAKPAINDIGEVIVLEPIVVESSASPIKMIELAPVSVSSVKPKIYSQKAKAEKKETKAGTCGEWTDSLVGGTFRACEYL